MGLLSSSSTVGSSLGIPRLDIITSATRLSAEAVGRGDQGGTGSS